MSHPVFRNEPRVVALQNPTLIPPNHTRCMALRFNQNWGVDMSPCDNRAPTYWKEALAWSAVLIFVSLNFEELNLVAGVLGPED